MNEKRYLELPEDSLIRWIALLLLFFSVFARSESIVVFGAEDYPVICFMKDGRPQGVFPTVLAGVSKFSGDTYDVQLLPWPRAQAMALLGNGAVAHFSKTTEREAEYDFSDPVVGDDIDLVVLKGKEFSYKEPRDLKGKRVGAKFGASFGQQVDGLMQTGAITVDRDYGIASRLRKLLAGRVDVAIVEGSGGDINALTGADRDLIENRARFAFLPVPLVHDPLYLAFAKSMNRKDALERFNAGLAKFKKTAGYRKLIGY